MVFFCKANKSRCPETRPKSIVHNISFQPPLGPTLARCACLWLGGMAWVSPVPIIPRKWQPGNAEKKTYKYLVVHAKVSWNSVYSSNKKLAPIYLTMIQDTCWMIRRLFQLWNWDNFAMSHVGAVSIIKRYNGWKSSSCTNQHHYSDLLGMLSFQKKTLGFHMLRANLPKSSKYYLPFPLPPK